MTPSCSFSSGRGVIVTHTSLILGTFYRLNKNELNDLLLFKHQCELYVKALVQSCLHGKHFWTLNTCCKESTLMAVVKKQIRRCDHDLTAKQISISSTWRCRMSKLVLCPQTAN